MSRLPQRCAMMESSRRPDLERYKAKSSSRPYSSHQARNTRSHNTNPNLTRHSSRMPTGHSSSTVDRLRKSSLSSIDRARLSRQRGIALNAYLEGHDAYGGNGGHKQPIWIPKGPKAMRAPYIVNQERQFLLKNNRHSRRFNNNKNNNMRSGSNWLRNHEPTPIEGDETMDGVDGVQRGGCSDKEDKDTDEDMGDDEGGDVEMKDDDGTRQMDYEMTPSNPFHEEFVSSAQTNQALWELQKEAQEHNWKREPVQKDDSQHKFAAENGASSQSSTMPMLEPTALPILPHTPAAKACLCSQPFAVDDFREEASMAQHPSFPKLVTLSSLTPDIADESETRGDASEPPKAEAKVLPPLTSAVVKFIDDHDQAFAVGLAQLRHPEMSLSDACAEYVRELQQLGVRLKRKERFKIKTIEQRIKATALQSTQVEDEEAGLDDGEVDTEDQESNAEDEGAEEIDNCPVAGEISADVAGDGQASVRTASAIDTPASAAPATTASVSNPPLGESFGNKSEQHCAHQKPSADYSDVVDGIFEQSPISPQAIVVEQGVMLQANSVPAVSPEPFEHVPRLPRTNNAYSEQNVSGQTAIKPTAPGASDSNVIAEVAISSSSTLRTTSIRASKDIVPGMSARQHLDAQHEISSSPKTPQKPERLGKTATSTRPHTSKSSCASAGPQNSAPAISSTAMRSPMALASASQKRKRTDDDTKDVLERRKRWQADEDNKAAIRVAPYMNKFREDFKQEKVYCEALGYPLMRVNPESLFAPQPLEKSDAMLGTKNRLFSPSLPTFTKAKIPIVDAATRANVEAQLRPALIASEHRAAPYSPRARTMAERLQHASCIEGSLRNGVAPTKPRRIQAQSSASSPSLPITTQLSPRSISRDVNTTLIAPTGSYSSTTRRVNKTPSFLSNSSRVSSDIESDTLSSRPWSSPSSVYSATSIESDLGESAASLSKSETPVTDDEVATDLPQPSPWSAYNLVRYGSSAIVSCAQFVASTSRAIRGQAVA